MVEESSTIGPVVVGAVLIFGIAQSVLLLTIKPWSRRCVALMQAPSCLVLSSSHLASRIRATLLKSFCCSQSGWCLGRPVCIRDIVLHW
jgi:hypothetical protein